MSVGALKVIIIFPATGFSWSSYHCSLSVISYQATNGQREREFTFAVFRNLKLKNCLKSMKVFSTNWERKFTNQKLRYLGLVTSDGLRGSDHDLT